MGEWQPIETAPRGEIIVGLKLYCVGAQPAAVGELYDPKIAGGPALIDRWHGRWWRVTHWMPLPLPPGRKEG